MADLRPWRRVAADGSLAVLLVRHGRTAYNAERRFCGGRSDPPLDERGREQAAALGERFAGELSQVFCSPLARARATAAALGEPVVIEGLRELDQGAFEGRAIYETLAEHDEFFRAWKRDPSALPIPGGGESMSDLAARVAAAMLEIQLLLGERWPGQVIAVVGHQMAHGALICHALGLPLRSWSQFELRNARANLLAWDGQRYSLVGSDL